MDLGNIKTIAPAKTKVTLSGCGGQSNVPDKPPC